MLRAYFDEGKQVLPGGVTPDRAALDALLGWADIVVSDVPVLELEAIGLPPESLVLVGNNPVVVVLTLAGLKSPYRQVPHHDLLAHALGGTAFATPPRAINPDEEPPLRPGGYQADYTSGLAMAVASLFAFRRRKRTQRGELIDISAQAVLASFLRWELSWQTYDPDGIGKSGLNVAGATRHFPPTSRRAALNGLIPCSDGYVAFQASEQYQWEGLIRTMGNPEWATRDHLADPASRIEHWAELEPLILDWFRQQSKLDVFHRAQQERVPLFPCLAVNELLDDPQMVAREFFRSVSPEGSETSFVVPGFPLRLSETPFDPASRGPDVETSTGRNVEATSANGADSLPLAGITVADFSWVVAGPFCTAMLAALGADVIRIESSVHTDVVRRTIPMADGEWGIERCGQYHELNLNKRSVTLNLATDEGRALAKELALQADVVVQNFAPGKIDRMGLGYEALAEVNPRIIMASASGLGSSGPYRDYVAFGPPLTAYCGLASLTGQIGGQPERGVAGGVWCDYQASLSLALGILAALEHRDRSGRGQYVDCSLAEANTAQLLDAFVAFQVSGGIPGPQGNRDSRLVPHGIFRARGPEAWIAVVAQDDEAWFRLREIVPGPDWWCDASLERASGRRERVDEIEHVLASWTQTKSVDELVSILRAANVLAAPVASVADLLSDESLEAANFFVAPIHPEVGVRKLAGFGWSVGWADYPPQRPAPMLGEHNWSVFVESLGMTPERFASLVASGVIS